jgi:transcription-repair coupling factor (superfamily II helicase)
VDIPNVNTMIVFSAQHYGLSDLHQLRGRVGRSNRKAYCYLVAPERELLTEDARRRLDALSTFAELGSEIENHISHRARAVEKLAHYLKEK